LDSIDSLPFHPALDCKTKSEAVLRSVVLRSCSQIRSPPIPIGNLSGYEREQIA